MSFAGVLISLLLLAMCWVPRNPNQCNFWGAVIGGALSLVGSLKNNKSSKAAHASDTYNKSPQGIRANAEEAGFNPGFVMSQGRSYGAGYSPTFENAGVHLGRAVEAGITGLQQQKLKVTQLKNQNQRLNRLVEKTTFDVNAPSVYERRRMNVGKNTDNPVQSVASGVDPRGIAIAGKTVNQDTGFSDAEDAEARYGDVLSSVYGVGVAIADGIETYANTQFGKARLRFHNDLTDFYNPPESQAPTRPRSRPSGRIKSPSLSGGNANDFYQSVFN